MEVDNTIVTVHVDHKRPRVTLDGDRHVETVLRAQPAVVLGLAAGALTLEQAIAMGPSAAISTSLPPYWVLGKAAALMIRIWRWLPATGWRFDPILGAAQT